MLAEELDRARRFGHPFAVAQLERDGSARAPAPGDLAGAVRSVDLVWTDPAAAYVLLRETDRAGAERFLGRLERDAPGLVAPARTRVVAFPEDELTGTALLDRLAHASADPAESGERDASRCRARRSSPSAPSTSWSARCSWRSCSHCGS